MGKRTIRILFQSDPVWPQRCVLCMGEVSQNLPVIHEHKVFSTPYCADCYPKVSRHNEMEGGLAIISIFITGAALIILLIIAAIRNASVLMQGSTCGFILVGGTLFIGIIYFLGRLLLLVFFQFSRKRFLSPGVKITKTKHPAAVNLIFSNSKYAQLFVDINSLN